METTLSKTRYRHWAMFTTAAINVASLFVATKMVIILDPQDRISIKRGSALTALGLVYFVSLFELLNSLCMYTAVGARFRQKYSLSCGDILDINNKVVSGVQALFCCITGAVVCTWSCSRDFLRTSHYMSEAYAWFGAAYFFYDIWSMYMVHVEMNSKPTSMKRRPSSNGSAPLSSGDGPLAHRSTSFIAYCAHEPVILFHHLFIGGFGFLVITYFRGDLGDCTFGFAYLMEFSTPFVSLRGILSRLQLKSSKAYLYNGITMLVTFFVFRVASMPYVCFMYSRVLGVSYLEAIASLPRGCKISICILLLPQLYWFYLMCAGALKMLGGPRRAARGRDSAGSASASGSASGSASASASASASGGSAGDAVRKRS